MNERTYFRRTVFEIYCIVMLILLLFQRSPHALRDGSWIATMRANLNLVPGDTIRRYLRLWGTERYHAKAVENLLGNIIPFMPFGFGLPWAHGEFRAFWKTFLFAAGLVAIIEATQLVTLLGHCDVDDLILNLIGVTGGYLLYLIFSKLGVRS